MTPHPASASLPIGWCLAPPLVLGLAALATLLGDGNMAGFVTLNQWSSALPGGFWASVTDTASVLSAGAVLALCLNVAPRAVFAAVLSWPAGIIMVRGLKYLLDEPRPQDVLATDSLQQIGVTLSGHSFPSGHTATAFTLIAAWILTTPACRRALPAILLLLAGALVGLSRIAVGAHWPGDVLAGAAVGWLCGTIGAGLASRWPLWRSRRALLALVAAGIVVCLARVFVVTGYPQAQLWSTALGLAGLVALGRALQRLPAARP
ncbi:phosphatase PAP2 family protein [Denitromonas iodatirespirans]|uniref:Phosphatase PAP2 family protein n=1 Tax=Denitromonas iodatirespirans TaxID=2795389 RepID=A0A944DIA7_DENI1|nr:phosphatase PAP2 family protein [Denitromonas iodatirespirans]MBT0963393.1 phosphatase PAP2 family protein [Denitromonas iodatirespirans]